jgi:hypothetical protein
MSDDLHTFNDAEVALRSRFSILQKKVDILVASLCSIDVESRVETLLTV